MSAADLVARVLVAKPTHLSGTPTFWRALLLALTKETPLPLRQITLGGEAVDQSILDALRAAFPEARIIAIYASTEAGALFAVKDGRTGFPATWLREGIEGCELRIVDGVLQVRSPRAMRGYLGDATKRALTDDGWLITGDVVEVTGERVEFRGRVDNVINVGGGKVMPEQVEAALLEVPVVREVRVYGIKNPIAGDVLAADVVLAQAVTEAEARKAIFSALSARLEPYKVPRIYRFVDKISVNATGKKVRVNS
jgi:acyl-CoA synthetase (AMP-forming)/AMP-acid ligase II